MNMISTGAFLPEMDASNKQETMAEKFARVWEKKNSKVARAGGVSLMALSLAACGSSSDTTTTAATPTPTPTPDPEPTTPVVPAGETSTLTDEANTVVGTAGDDTINATTDTLNATDTIVDESSTDSDTLNITATADVNVAPRLSGIENINVTATSVLGSGDTTLNVNVASLAASNYTFDVNNADSLIAALAITNADSGSYTATGDFTDIDIATDADADIVLTIGADAVIDTTGAADDLTIHGGGFDVDLNSSAATEDLVIDGAVDLVVDSMTALVGNATLTASNDVDAQVDAAEGNFTVTAGRDVTLASADAAEGDVTVTAGRDITDIDAGAATGNVTVTAGRDIAAISVEGAEGTVSVTAGGTIALTTATAAETVILNNTGAEAGDGITITDANSATTVTVTSVGAVTATANNGLAAVETGTITAAADSSVTIGAVAAQTLNLNAANADGDAITYTLIGDSATDVLETLNLGGSSEIIVAVEGDEITEATVTSTNAVAAAVFLGDEDVDVTNFAANVAAVMAGDFNANTITVDGDSNVNVDVEVDQTGTVTITHETNATASTNNTFTLGLYDSAATNGDTTAAMAGMTFTDIQGLTIAMGDTDNGVDSSADLSGADLETVTVTGSGAFDLNTNTILGDATNRVTLDASGVEGIVTMQLEDDSNGTAVNTITTGSGADAITLASIAASDAGHSITSSGGADTVVVTVNGDGATAKFSYDGGTGTDTLQLNTNTDISDSTVTLTSVERILIEGHATQNVDVSSALITGKSFIIAENGTDTAVLNVVVDGTSVNLSGLAFETSFASGTDSIVVDGSGNAVTLSITGSSADDVIDGGSSADTITAGGGADTVTGGAGADVIDLTETTAAADDVVFEAGGHGADVITGFGSADQILFGADDDNAGADSNVFDAGDLVFADTDAATTVGAKIDLAAADYNEIAVSGTIADNHVNVLTTEAGYASVTAALDAIDTGGSAGDNESIVLVFYNSADEEVQAHYVSDTGADGNARTDAVSSELCSFTDIAAADIASTFSEANFGVICIV